MKKIYILTAVFALLTLSLNAQNDAVNHNNRQVRNELKSSKYFKAHSYSFNDVLRDIKGMSGILPEANPNGSTAPQGQFRAPLKVNADEVTLGPFTGDGFSQSGIGFGNAYDQAQQVLINTILERDEIIDYNGYEIVGFRFALASQSGTNNKARVYNFISWPESENGYFEAANRHTWNLGEWSTAPAGYQLINNDLVPSNFTYSTDISVSAPWTATNVRNQSQSDASFYIRSGGNLKFTVPSGYSNADFKFEFSTRGSYYSGSLIFTPSTGSAQTVTTSAANTVYNCELTGLSTGDVVTISFPSSASYSIDFTYMYVYANGGTANYVELEGGQWYEYYLDEPIEFVVNDTISALDLGYTYEQYPSSNTTEMLYPIAVNTSSQTHDHWANLITGSSTVTKSNITITVPSYNTSFYQIIVYDGETGNTITSWNSSMTTGTYNGNTYYVMPTGWSMTNANYMWQETVSGYNFGYLSNSGQASIVINQSQFSAYNNVGVYIIAIAWEDNQSITVNNNTKAFDATSTFTEFEWPNIFNAATSGWQHLSTFSSTYGDLAVQLILKSSGPELTAPVDGSTVNVGTNYGSGVSQTIPVSGNNLTGDLTVSVTGDGFSVSTNSITAADANNGTSITVTYNGTDPNATGTLTITSSNGEVNTVVVDLTASYAIPVPALNAPTDGSTVNVGTNTGDGVSQTITVSGENLTGDLILTVDGAYFTVEPSTITAADANAGTTITVTYSGYSADATGTLTITSSNGEVGPVTVNLTGSFSAQPATPVTGLLRMHMLMVDQLKANIPDDNSHADAYRYVLKYEPQGEDPKESTPVTVDIQKTECEVKGYYTKAEIDADTTGVLPMSILTADVQFNLTDDDNTIDFYNLQGLANEYPALGENYLTKLQQTSGFVYYEMLEGPNKGDDYPAGIHHYYDDSNPLQGTYTNGFMSYAPSLSTWGVDRRYYEDDGLDNTYGAPIWRTRVGDVQIQGKPAMQKQVINAGTSQEANNPHTTWTANGKTYCLYFLGVNAQAMLPNTEGTYGTNIKYEPYMFRVFVESPTGKLRKFKRELGEGGGYYAVDDGPITGKYCVGSFDIESDTWTPNDLFFHKPITNPNSLSFRSGGDDEFDPNAWDGVMKFGAEDGTTKNDIKVYVRFYYMVEGWNTRDGESRPGNGAEGSGDPDDPSTFVYELVGNGEVVGVTYVNAQGMTSDKPFDGFNIVITKFSDGTTTTTKVMR